MATITPKELKLKDGSSALLRSGSLQDLAAFDSHVEAILKDGNGMVAEPGEIQFTEEKRRNRIKKLTDHPDKLLLVCMQDDRLIANLDFHAGKRKRIAHVGGFGISVHPQWRGLGIGNALIEEMISWAISNPRLEKITLSVLASNESAINLYSKFGFVEEGRNSKAIKYQDGSYVDDVQMARFVDRP